MKKKPILHKTIKNYNRKKILSVLAEKREITRQEIAFLTGISFPTVTSNIDHLIKEGIVMRSGEAVSTGGRKPQLVRFVPDARFSFGVELELEKTRIVLINLDGEIKEDIIFPTDPLTDINLVIKEIAKYIELIINKLNIPSSKIVGIGFSLPGTVNDKRMLLELAPNLHVKNLDFSNFQNSLKFPIHIENEANAAALAELYIKPSAKYQSMAFISITYGVGVGLILNRRLYHGRNKRAGEFGHMTIEKNGKACACGKTGCWELYASERVLLEEYQKERGQKAKSLSDFFQLLLEDGCEAAKRVWSVYLDNLALGIQNIILALDPQAIIIGGEISQFFTPWLAELKDRIFIKNSFFYLDDTNIQISRLGKDASVLGAAILPIMQKL